MVHGANLRVFKGLESRRMKPFLVSAFLGAGILVLSWTIAGAVAVSLSTPIPHRAPFKAPAGKLFDELKTGFSGGRFGPYQVVDSDAPARTIVVKRNAIDPESWSKWAYCRVDPIDMIDSLRDGKAMLTVKLEPTTKTVTYAVIWAEFNGDYGIGNVNKNFQCTSTGVLEEHLLHRIGATTP
jgi:hypothetical protein